MLRRLLLRKSKEILAQVDSAENIIKEAEVKISKLKNTDEFTVLREELVRLITSSNYFTRDLVRYEMSAYSGDYQIEKKKQIDDVLMNINECLDEMDRIYREKYYAISEGKESK